MLSDPKRRRFYDEFGEAPDWPDEDLEDPAPFDSEASHTVDGEAAWNTGGGYGDDFGRDGPDDRPYGWPYDRPYDPSDDLPEDWWDDLSDDWPDGWWKDAYRGIRDVVLGLATVLVSFWLAGSLLAVGVRGYSNAREWLAWQQARRDMDDEVSVVAEAEACLADGARWKALAAWASPRPVNGAGLGGPNAERQRLACRDCGRQDALLRNDLGADALFVLRARGTRLERSVYVKAHSVATVPALKPGAYTVEVVVGEGDFTRCGYFRDWTAVRRLPRIFDVPTPAEAGSARFLARYFLELDDLTDEQARPVALSSVWAS